MPPSSSPPTVTRTTSTSTPCRWRRRRRPSAAPGRIGKEGGSPAEAGPPLGGLFKQQYRGSRYSWGYPACPDLDDQAKVAELLEIERIGVTVSEEFQLHPEQTTSAIIVHHPEAK